MVVKEDGENCLYDMEARYREKRAVTTEFGTRNPRGYQRTLTADSSHLLKCRVPGTGLKVEGPVGKELYVGDCSFISRLLRPK